MRPTRLTIRPRLDYLDAVAIDTIRAGRAEQERRQASAAALRARMAALPGRQAAEARARMASLPPLAPRRPAPPRPGSIAAGTLAISAARSAFSMARRAPNGRWRSGAEIEWMLGPRRCWLVRDLLSDAFHCDAESLGERGLTASAARARIHSLELAGQPVPPQVARAAAGR
jgi:hypothetical protein